MQSLLSFKLKFDCVVQINLIDTDITMQLFLDCFNYICKIVLCSILKFSFPDKNMDHFQLTLFFKIIGLGSASGLIYQNNNVILIGDNSGFLYDYNVKTKKLNTHPLIENASANIEKKQKPDFEAITQFENAIYIFGSGSTENRNMMIHVDAATKKIVQKTDLSRFYLSLQNSGKIKQTDFNIEGVHFDGTTWYVANRGNGKKTKNIIFKVEGKSLDAAVKLAPYKFKLPKIKDVKTSFTDMVLIKNKIYFLAAAEDTDSTFFDGAIMGTVLGRIDTSSMTIDFIMQISDNQKFEGITLFEKTESSLTFLLCEDNDSPILESSIYKLTLTK